MLPTLSQIKTWDRDHLADAARCWSAAADIWERVFCRVWQQSYAADVERHAGGVLQDPTSSDISLVGSRADWLRQAAAISRKGAGDIDSARRCTIRAIQDARNAGFSVGEDLSVTDARDSRNAQERAARQALAKAFAANICHRAAALVALDEEVVANLTRTVGDCGNVA